MTEADKLNRFQKDNIVTTLERAVKYPQLMDRKILFLITGLTLRKISDKFPNLSFAGIENILQERRSRVHLIARPISEVSTDSISNMSLEDYEEERPFYLGVCFGGNENFEQELKTLETTPEENIERLSLTGILHYRNPQKNNQIIAQIAFSNRASLN